MEILGILFWIIGFLFIEDESFNIPLEVIWKFTTYNLVKKGRIYSAVQEASSGRGGWPKKSKPTVEERAIVATIEDDFSKADGSRSDVVDNGHNDLNSNGDGNEEQNS